mmetsp:Transcript_27395/g.60148  ORF Transcript_27395/g.60148 Transcript_27395/m.60148 type:complete len:88 (-) Transcript_27395:861-1124(-)
MRICPWRVLFCGETAELRMKRPGKITMKRPAKITMKRLACVASRALGYARSEKLYVYDPAPFMPAASEMTIISFLPFSRRRFLSAEA